MLGHELVDFEQLVALADGDLDLEDRETMGIHLKTCPTCREDVRDFLEYREQTSETEP